MNDLFCLKTLKKAGYVKKMICSVMVVTFLTSLIAAPAGAQILPVPGTPVTLSAGFQPPVLLGLKIHPENPLLFDFIVDQGALRLSDDELKLETEKLVKYFLAALTIPDKEVWVNLSPYEKDKIVPDALGQTAMGKTMLEQDYMLKQLASSLTNPDEKLGREFWANVKNQVQAQLNTKDIPMSTFNKVWIVPQKAEVLESQGIVLIGEKRLKVMMDQDYVAMEKNEQGEIAKAKDVSTISTGIFKDTVLPLIEKEINEGKNFADVRQIYNSVILATWYKKALKESLLGKVYADKSKVAGVETDDKDMKQRIYEQYLAAFKKGVYNLIKEESDSAGDMIPRKYFSGGIKIANFTASSSLLTRPVSLAQAGQVIENASSKAVRVQMAEPKSDEGRIIASSALFSSPTEFIPASALSGADTLSGLLSLFNQRGIRYQELYDYLSPLFNRLRTQQQPVTQGAIQVYINEQTMSGRTAIKELGVSKSQVVTQTFNEWMLDIERSHPNFLKQSEPLTWLLAAVLEELKTPQGLRGHYLTGGAHLYVPLVDQRMTEVVFGNDKVNVLYSEGKLIFSEGVIGSQTSARYIGEKSEYVYIGRDVSADHIVKLRLKNANLTVSQTHFSARLRDVAGSPYLEIIDGDASKLTGSTNGTLVLNRAVVTGEFRLISGAVIGRPIQTPKTAELGINTTARQLEVSGTFAQRIIVTSAYLPIDIGVTNGKLWLRVNGTSSEFSNDSVTRFLEFGRPYVVNRFDPDAPLDVAANKLDLKVNGQSGISRPGNFEVTIVPNGRYFDFTVKDLKTRNTTFVNWTDIKASSAVGEIERNVSELLTSIGANATRIDEMLADFDKPGVEVSGQFRQQMFQWKASSSFFQGQSLAVAEASDLVPLAIIEQKMTAIRNTIERSFHVWIGQGNNTAFQNWEFSNSYDYQGRVMYHVVPLSVWQAQKNGDYYRSDRFDADGFIHFSADPVTAVAAANRYYGQTGADVVVLKVNAIATTGSGNLVIDNGQSQYPHLYGAMPTNAVIQEIVLGRNLDGNLDMPSDILKRELASASSSVASDDVIVAMQSEVAALGIDAVKGTGNIHSYTSPDGLDFVVRLFRDKAGKDFTVFEIFLNENEVTNYAILEGNFINLSAEELWAKYLGPPAASSGVTEGDVESALQIKIERMGLNSVGEDPSVYKSFSVGSGDQEVRYNVRLYYSGNESPYTVIRRYQVVNAVAKLSEFSLLSGNFIQLDAVQLRGLHETYQSNSVSSAIIMDSGKSFEGKLEVQFQRDDEGVILTDGKLVPGDELNSNKQYMRAYRVSTFDYGRRVKIMSGRYYSGENIFDMTGGGGAYEAEYLGLPRDPVVDSVTLKAQAINSPFGLEVTVSKGDAKSFNYQARMTAPPAVEAQTASAPTVDANKFTKGGIDFDPTNMNLQIKRDGKGVPLPLPQQNLEQINIQGLVPIIINIVPINSQTLPIFLGQAEKEPGREPETAMNVAS
ncbi:MAG: DUF952 domain-containing protein [Candidatus Omnitrophica bacterium]|nr:DUF952 domain-containing protein [Candidatus Omnitrophota bacterium]